MTVSRTYGFDMHMTHEEIAEVLSREEGKPITRQRVVQIEREAMAKLRARYAHEVGITTRS